MVCHWSMVEGVANTNISNVTCDEGKYTSGDSFHISLAYVVQDLETLTSTRPNYEYHNISPYPNAFAYGHAACNPNLIASDCKTCLDAAKTAMFGECLKRKGACGARSMIVLSVSRQQETIQDLYVELEEERNASPTAGVDLRGSVIQVPERDQVYQPSEEELRSYIDPYEYVFCSKYLKAIGDDDLMLLCDLCDFLCLI
ncbi:hypothetical protein K1719_037684 [Acacia pycnantha]|nr:hypothetical protein K1719_037684 [Acacia pycnantha]